MWFYFFCDTNTFVDLYVSHSFFQPQTVSCDSVAVPPSRESGVGRLASCRLVRLGSLMSGGERRAAASALVSARCLCCSHNIGWCFCFPLSAVPGRRQNTIVVKVPGQDDSHNEDGESGSEASDSVSNCGQSGSQNIGNNVTLITLNSEGAPAKLLSFA